MAGSNEILIFTAINDTDVAEELITNMLEADLIVSGTMFPGTTLFYRWENKINLDEEVKIILKSTRDKYEKIEDYLMHRHPYRMPEITTVDASFGTERFREFCRNKP